MRRQENVVSKTVRMDGGLVEAVEAVLKREDGGYTYRNLNFSEAVRYGLVLLLAAHGEKYVEPEAYNRMKVVSHYRSNATLDAARTILLKSTEPVLVDQSVEETA